MKSRRQNIEEARAVQADSYQDERKEMIVVKLKRGRKETRVKRKKTTEEVVVKNWA